MEKREHPLLEGDECSAGSSVYIGSSRRFPMSRRSIVSFRDVEI